MSASNNFITKPVLSTVCSLLIVIVGLIAIPILPIENLPDIAPPTVKVQATYVGADAVAVEQGVTSVLEQQINGVENMDFITSNSSSDGVSSISVSFDSGTDGSAWSPGVSWFGWSGAQYLCPGGFGDADWSGWW